MNIIDSETFARFCFVLQKNICDFAFYHKWFILNYFISWPMYDCFSTFAMCFYIIVGGISVGVVSEKIPSKNFFQRISNYTIKNSINSWKVFYNTNFVHLRYRTLVIQNNRSSKYYGKYNQWFPHQWYFLYPLTNRFSNTESFYMKVLRGTGIPQLGSGSKNYVYAWLFSSTFRSIYLAYR